MNMKHRCGGKLQPRKFKIRKKTGYYFQSFTVEGYVCDYCGEEVISRDIAFQIDKTIEQLRQSWKGWRVPGDTKATSSYSQRPTETIVREPVIEDDTYVKTNY